VDSKLDSFSFALHCLANVKLLTLVHLLSLLLILILHPIPVEWSYLFHAIHLLDLLVLLLPSHPLFLYPLDISSFLSPYSFNLSLPWFYLLCIQIAHRLTSPYFSNNDILWILSIDFWFQSLLFIQNHLWTIHAMCPEACSSKPLEEWSYQFIAWSQSLVTKEAMPLLRRITSDSINNDSTVPWVNVDWWNFVFFLMMLGFMTLIDSFLCNDYWCIVGLISTMTSIA
jgi:hypothetical protein